MSTQNNPELADARIRNYAKEITMGVLAVGLAIVGSTALAIYNKGNRTRLSSSGGWKELDLVESTDSI